MQATTIGLPCQIGRPARKHAHSIDIGGCAQVHGIDQDKTFCANMRSTSFGALTAIANSAGMKMRRWDFLTAYTCRSSIVTRHPDTQLSVRTETPACAASKNLCTARRKLVDDANDCYSFGCATTASPNPPPIHVFSLSHNLSKTFNRNSLSDATCTTLSSYTFTTNPDFMYRNFVHALTKR
eukprot:3635790-Pleurochrysis_carterae.AAC.1